MKYTYWKSGDWNAICDVCGHKYKASDLKLRWDGLMVCDQDWEQRHPQELLRPIPDQSKLPWTRPEGQDQFVSVTYANTGGCTPITMLCQADYGTADCATVGNVNGALVP